MKVNDFANKYKVSAVTTLQVIKDLYRFEARRDSVIPKNLQKQILLQLIKSKKVKGAATCKFVNDLVGCRRHNDIDFTKRVMTSDNFHSPTIYVPMGGKVK
ncbi:hypothetical protein [Segetibacter aerophilus]|uniref:Uncharacterized protein n=1 Tax=Segetibacter aerophilus TaxID=670293 RepID=A0A512BJ96_9BACT|nr:hypothetical protein [Segetibacter aerophilus]GEO12036.1 hypothetical protein SAE01_45320 [Segetibacter aerophilus]